MRTMMYGIINKETGDIIYKSTSLVRCMGKMAKLENSKNYDIVHKWFSI